MAEHWTMVRWQFDYAHKTMLFHKCTKKLMGVQLLLVDYTVEGMVWYLRIEDDDAPENYEQPDI